MTNDLMREAYRAKTMNDHAKWWADSKWRIESKEATWDAWQAAYAAGMDRAAGIADGMPCGGCVANGAIARAIRAEIPK